MKKIAIILAMCFVIPIAMLAEDNDLKKLMNKYKNVAGFDLEISDPDVDLELDDLWDFGDFLNDISKVYVLDFDRKEGGLNDLENFQAKLNKLIDKKDFKTMVDINGEGSIKVLRRKNDSDKTSDYLIITEDEDDAVVIWATTN